MFGRIITRSTNKPIAPTSSAIRRSRYAPDCSVARTGLAVRTSFGLPEPTGGALATNIFDFDIGAGGASSGPTPFPFLDGGSATNSRAGSEVGRVQIVFSRDADQSEQPIPAGVSQRGLHPAGGRSSR